MSWWDSAGFTNLATQALKTAQQRIDKVLDISDNPSGGMTLFNYNSNMVKKI